MNTIRKTLGAAMAIAALVSFGLAGQAAATHTAPHQVLVCKYVGQPGTDERLQTGQNPIVVDEAALVGKGFLGIFPWEFQDKQGQSIAVRYLASGEKAGDKFSLDECPVIESSPTPTPSESPSATPTPSASSTPTPKASGTPSPKASGTPAPSSNISLKTTSRVALANTAFAKPEPVTPANSPLTFIGLGLLFLSGSALTLRRTR